MSEWANDVSRGCLPLIFKAPVHLEPPISGTSLGIYNRETSETLYIKVCPSVLDEATPESSEIFLNSLRGLVEPISFEIIGSASGLHIQIVIQKRDRHIVERAFDSICPHSYTEESDDPLFDYYSSAASRQRTGSHKTLEFHINDYNLPPPFYFPINTPSKGFPGDPLDALFSVFSTLEADETGFYQALFIPTRSDWAGLARTLVGMRDQDSRLVMTRDYSAYSPWLGDYPKKIETRPTGKEYHPHLSESELKHHTWKFYAKIKHEKPFFAVSLRIGLFAHKGKAPGVLKTLKSALNTLTPGDRPFRFLTREHYNDAGVPDELLYYSVFNRVSLRAGMLLTTPELSGLVHLPTQDTLNKGFPIETAKGRRPAPDSLTSPERKGIMLGEEIFRGRTRPIVLSHEERARHMHIIGKQGSGKSNLIARCVLQDIDQGTGVCVIDPHGDLIDRSIVPMIPDEHMHRVIYFDPVHSPIRLNILDATQVDSNSFASDVVSIFRRLSEDWAKWGIQMDTILSYSVSAVLSNKSGGHLGTLHDFLIDKDFRKGFLKGIADNHIVKFWEKEFPLYPRGSVAPVLRRLDMFLKDPNLRRIVTQRESSIDFRRIMDEGNVLLVRLAAGSVEAKEAYMLGSLIASRLHAAAMTREDIPEEMRKPFYLFIDEFANFTSKSVEESIYGTRKFSLGLVLCHHTWQQLVSKDRDVAEAVRAAYTRICFQPGDRDASDLAEGFQGYDAHDLNNLNVGEAVVRVGGSANAFEMKVPYEPPPAVEIAEKRKRELIALTRERYGIDAYGETKRGVVIPFKSSVVKIEEVVTEEYSEEAENRKTEVKPEKTEKETVETVTAISEHRKQEIQYGKRIHLTPDERKFLEFIGESKGPHPLPVRDIYKGLGMGVSKGDRLKNILIERKLLTEKEASLGTAKRKSKILNLTTLGYEALSIPIPEGKGSTMHKYIQELIVRHAEASGYSPAVEEMGSNGKRVDVGLRKGGERIAVEVSVTTRPQQVMENIELDLQGGYDRVIVVCQDAKALTKTKNFVLEKLNAEKYPNVQFILASEIAEKL